MAGRKWTEAEDADLRELYPDRSNEEVARILNERHGNGRNKHGVNQRARKYGITKREGYARPMPRRFWPDEKREWFMAFVPGHTETEISAEHERLYGTPLTRPQISNAKTMFGVKSGTKGGCFEKGHVPHNKGKTWEEQGRSPEAQEKSRSTCFKKGNIPHNALDKEVGYERVDKNGYVEVKVKNGRQDEANDNFRRKHHIVYEQAHGEIPKGCNIVFADQDRSNFDPDNLVAVPRRLWSTLRKMGLPYYDAESLKTAMNVARLKQAKSSVQMRPRACVICGKDFTPRFANQKRCDPCIKLYGAGRKKK